MASFWHIFGAPIASLFGQTRVRSLARNNRAIRRFTLTWLPLIIEFPQHRSQKTVTRLRSKFGWCCTWKSTDAVCRDVRSTTDGRGQTLVGLNSPKSRSLRAVHGLAPHVWRSSLDMVLHHRTMTRATALAFAPLAVFSLSAGWHPENRMNVKPVQAQLYTTPAQVPGWPACS